MSLYLIWRGTDSPSLYERLSIIARFAQNLAHDSNLGFERLLDDYIQTIFLSNSSVCKIDGHLYWTGNLNDLHLSIPITYDGDNIFPSIVLEDATIDEITLETLYNTICVEIGDCIRLHVKYKLENTFIQTSLNIYIETKIEVVKSFERSRLGIFLYLLYLSKKYSNSCILVSELQPLFKKCLQVEADLLSMPKTAFLDKYVFYNNKYDKLLSEYKTNRIFIFRIGILFNILSQMGPFVVSEFKESKGVTGKITNSFKTLFNKCKEEKKRFSIGFSIISMPEGAHGTVIIIDNVERVIERFDPNGYNTRDNQAEDKMDAQLTLFAKETGYLYASPDTFCPKLGIQQIEQFFSSNIGYCVSWSIIYAEERLSSKYDRKYVADNLLEIVIAKYKITGRTMEEKAFNLQIWIDNRIKDIFQGMETAFNDLSGFLEVPVSYIDNTLRYNLL